MGARCSAKEPVRTLERRALARGFGYPARHLGCDAIAGPFIVFFKAHGIAIALLTLGLITLYHLSDYMRGPMSGPFYKTLGIDKPTIAWVRGAIGVPMSLARRHRRRPGLGAKFGNKAHPDHRAPSCSRSASAPSLLAAHGSDDTVLFTCSGLRADHGL